MLTAAKKHLPAIVLVLVLWLLLAAFTYFWLVPKQINFDFYSNWVGAHEMLRGENPYPTPYTDEYLAARGYPILVHRQFKYPATIAWALLPFWVIPAKLAVSLWSGLQLLLAMLLPLLVFRLLQWRVRPSFFLVVMLVSLVGNYHTVNVYAIGQFTLFVLACFIFAWWGVVEQRAWLVVLALFCATIRLESIFIAGALLLDLLLARRYKTIASWAALTAGVVLVTFLQVGFWIPYVLRAVEQYHYVAQVSSHPPEALGIDALVPLITVVAVLWGAIMFWQTRALPDRTRFPWRASVAILAFLVILPQTHDYTLVYTFLPIWFLMWVGRHSAWTTPVLIAIMLASWGVYFAGSEPVAELQQLLTPILLAGILTFHWYRGGAAAQPVVPQHQ
ncbi:MAG: hypothetical protein JXN59_10120 [Anaerolineae bacterium]|nr:hypothetical protein [Anaerolineae bacterium]